MTADIESFLEQILSIRQDAPGVASGLTDDSFNWQPAPDRWSVGQCFEHLNITAARYLPVIGAAIDGARTAGRLAQGPFSYGFLERWFAKTMEPPAKRRFRAPTSFVAAGPLSRDEVMSRFEEMQNGFATLARRADGIDLRRVKVRSQFGPISFSLGQTFQTLLAHERRHIWQAREVRSEMARQERRKAERQEGAAAR